MHKLLISFVHVLFLSFNFTVHTKKDDDLLRADNILNRKVLPIVLAAE
jgi:hypothetical protein